MLMIRMGAFAVMVASGCLTGPGNMTGAVPQCGDRGGEHKCDTVSPRDAAEAKLHLGLQPVVDECRRSTPPSEPIVVALDVNTKGRIDKVDVRASEGASPVDARVAACIRDNAKGLRTSEVPEAFRTEYYAHDSRPHESARVALTSALGNAASTCNARSQFVTVDLEVNPTEVPEHLKVAGNITPEAQACIAKEMALVRFSADPLRTPLKMLITVGE